MFNIFYSLWRRLCLVIRFVYSSSNVGGSSLHLPGCIPLDDLAVTRQADRRTCVPAALDMLLEYHHPGRASTLLEWYRLGPGGMSPVDMMGFVAANLECIGLRLGRGKLAEAMRGGRPFLAIVVEDPGGHAVLVHGVCQVDGLTYMIVRDPARGAYRQRLVDFEARLVTDPDLLGFPTLWGER